MEGLLLIGEGFLISPLILRAEWQGTTLHDGYRGSVAVGLSEQTRGVRDALLRSRRFGDLFCLEDGRKHEISVSSVKKVIDGEDLSIQKQELEAILSHHFTCFYHLPRRAEQVQGVT